MKNNLNSKNIILDAIQRAIDGGDISKISEIYPLIDKILNKPLNLILLGDAYKYSHHKFYEDGTTKMYSYLESRGGKFNKTLFYGLQAMVKKYFEGVAFTQQDLDEAYEYLGTKFGVFGRDDVFDRSKFQYILDTYGGRLPVKIKAVKEGEIVPTKNVLLTIENTDPNCFWLTNFLETIILEIWYPITVATLSYHVKEIVKEYFDKTSSLPEDVREIVMEFVLNDFGFRASTSPESASIGGSAHLVNFMGSDTTIASHFLCQYYNTDNVWGLSVPATEHSIMTMKGETGERDMFKRVLEKYPTGIVACVSDSYNIIRACEDYLGEDLKDMILSRPGEPGNQLVIRPDSGHVINTLRAIFKILFDKFPFTVNEKGFKVLTPQVRVIQGDGVNINSIREIYEMMYEEGISAENIVFGMGGKLLQSGIDRDTQNFAIKASYCVVNGEERNLVKSPTEIDEMGNKVPSFKKSKQGRLKLIKNENGEFRTITSTDSGFDEAEDNLIDIFENGILINQFSFEEIRERAKNS